MKLKTASFPFKLKNAFSSLLHYFEGLTYSRKMHTTRIIQVKREAYTLWKTLETTEAKSNTRATEKMVFLQLNEKMKWVG